ncbi:MAG: hypothetical protein GWP05_00840 [Anaerolineaceae bacterium]|nr:hypothetical protein [Anaerolineaceae bacterium]
MFAVVTAVLAIATTQCIVAAGEIAAPGEITLSAAEAFEKGQGAWGVRLADDGKSVVLYDRALVEDDGPGIGSDAKWLKVDRSPTEKIGGATIIKKVLHVQRPRAMAARLCVPRGVQVEFNGRAIKTAANTRYPQIPVALLTQGDNEVVLSCPEGKSRRVKIATSEDILRNAPQRSQRPRRSFKSTDGGKTWQPINGEYMVRLHLVQYVEEGHFISPVIDLAAAPGDKGLLPAPVTVQAVTLKSEAETPAGTSIGFTVRSGPCPVYEVARWSRWRAAGGAVPQGHRYLQWKAVLRTTEATATPKLAGVTVRAEVSAEALPAWAAKVKVTAYHNEEIRYTSMPFANEDFKHPKLVALRKKYKLDQVVAGSKTEFEKLLKLRNWVTGQWKYDPPTEGYPAWDADEILTLKRGFCVQYAIVYMQCLQSLGYNARFVFGYHPGIMGGHEVTEVWSNQYNKWILMDANGNLHYIDPTTKEPLSMMEVHDRMTRAYYGDKKISRSNRPRGVRGAEDIATCRRMETSVEYSDPTTRKKPRWPRYAKWALIRMMPRNNFYSQQYPLPKTQGFAWDWTGYWVWEDARTPRSYATRYRNITGRRSDWLWTLNQVRFDAACGKKPGTVEIQMGTQTPNFETFLVNVDGKGWRPSGRAFQWRLHGGRNRLRMRTRNSAGVEGAISFLELDYSR